MSKKKASQITDEQLREINKAIGSEAFARLHALSDETYNAFCSLLHSGVDLHRDGYLGLKVDMPDSGWSSVCWSPYVDDGPGPDGNFLPSQIAAVSAANTGVKTRAQAETLRAFPGLKEPSSKTGVRVLTQAEAVKAFPGDHKEPSPRYEDFDPCIVIAGTRAAMQQAVTFESIVKVNGEQVGPVYSVAFSCSRSGDYDNTPDNTSYDVNRKSDTRIVVWLGNE